MHKFHAAIRGVAAIAALIAGLIAGVPGASAHQHGREADTRQHTHRPSKHRRRKHRKPRHRREGGGSGASHVRGGDPKHGAGHPKDRDPEHGAGHPTDRDPEHGAGHLTDRDPKRGAGHRIGCRVTAKRMHPAKAKHRPGCRSHTGTGKGVDTTPTPQPRPAATPVTPPAPAPSTAQSVQPEGASGSWSLVFDDEFNGSAINTSVWNEHDGWTNQNQVTDHSSNVTESGGVATLTLASSNSGATIGTNQAVLAVGDFAEARVNFAGSGTSIYNWPAWWASGPNWPAAGENDIAEGLGTLTVNYHSPSGTHNHGTIPGDWADAFHTFGIYRGNGYCDVYWDGRLVNRYSTDDDGQAQELLFTMGASNQLQFGASGQMEVDYVRVWAPG